MHRRLATALPLTLAVLVLTGCGASTDAACGEIQRAGKKVAIVTSDLLTQEVSARNLESAAAEIEEYVEPLREQPMPDSLVSSHAAIVDDMDELVVAIRAYDTDRMSDIRLRIAKTAVDVDVVCG